jgi:hypothetical protein
LTAEAQSGAAVGCDDPPAPESPARAEAASRDASSAPSLARPSREASCGHTSAALAVDPDARSMTVARTAEQRGELRPHERPVGRFAGRAARRAQRYEILRKHVR